MIKIRINNEINLSWTIYRLLESGKFPEDFTGADIVEMYIFDKSGVFRYSPVYTILDGTFRMTFPAVRQKQLGEYNLYLQYVKNGDTHTVDSCKAFELVSESCKQQIGGGTAEGVIVESVVLETQIDLLPAIIKEEATDYEKILNKPKINGKELIGNVSLQDLGISQPDLSGYATTIQVDEKITEAGINYVLKDGYIAYTEEDKLKLDNINYAGILREIGSLHDQKADKENIPTKVSQLTNDAKYLIDEIDPTVPAWAKEETKPIYTPDEIGALPIAHDTSSTAHTDIRQAIIDYLVSAKGYTDSRITDLIGAAPDILDTFEELATAIMTNQSAVDAINASITTKLGKDEAKGLYVAIAGYVAYTQAEKEKLASLQNYDDSSINDAITALENTKANKTSVPELRVLSQVDYDALPADKLTDGKYYFIV